MMSANSWIHFGLQIVFVCLYITPSHYHHYVNFIWRHWTNKIPVRYNMSSMWVWLSIFSQLSIIQYVGLCVFSLPISFVMIGRTNILCLIIIIKTGVWTITHCLWLGHETMVCAVCLSIFLTNSENSFLHHFILIVCIQWLQVLNTYLKTSMYIWYSFHTPWKYEIKHQIVYIYIHIASNQNTKRPITSTHDHDPKTRMHIPSDFVGNEAHY